jgi:hypothetical protein
MLKVNCAIQLFEIYVLNTTRTNWFPFNFFDLQLCKGTNKKRDPQIKADSFPFFIPWSGGTAFKVKEQIKIRTKF